MSTIVIRDSEGNVVTLDEFDKFFKRFIFLRVDMVLVVYLQLVGHELVAASVRPRQLSEQLGKIEGFEIWEQGFHMVKESFLVRQGPVYKLMRQKLQCRLRIVQEAQAGVVTAPVLYFHVATIGCVNAKQLVEAASLEMFKTVTNCDLGLRQVISKNGRISFSGSGYCELAQEWLLDICRHITQDDRMKDLLDVANDCYEKYKEVGLDKGNSGTEFDPNGSIGRGMLQNCDPVIDLVLGLCGKDLLELYVFLPCMTVGMLDESEHKYLKQASRYALARLEQDI